jgi:peptidylprolyl isomerase
MVSPRLLLSVLLLAAAVSGCKSEGSKTSSAPPEPVVVSAPPPGVLPAPADVAAAPKDAQRSESGLACVVLREGTGKVHPKIYDTVLMHQVVWSADGKMHMNTGSRGEAIKFEITKSVMPGVREAIELMVEGEKRRCWIPGRLAFGEGEPGAMSGSKPLGMLVYELDLVSLRQAQGLPEAPPDVAAVPDDAERSESGLAWRVLKEGSGDKKPTLSSLVSMNYTAWTADGEVFTSTAKQGRPRSTAVTGVIPGLREGLQLMRLGEKRRFWIPPELAYARQPGRPQGMLVYDVELLVISP